MAFLSIVTRTYKRPEALKRCKRSIARQADQDVEHIIIRDTVGVGCVEAYRLFLNVQPRGEYVMILDDDNLLASPWLVSDLKAVAEQHDPDVIVFKMDNAELGILPGRVMWRLPPIHGHIGSCNVAVKSHVWDACIGAIATDGKGGPPVYHSDLYYLKAVWAYTQSIYWLDKIGVTVPVVSRGMVE